MYGSAPRVLALDIGGTKLAAGVVSADGTVESFERMPTDVGRGPDAIMQSLLDLAGTAMANAGVTPCDIAAAGISCGGPLDAKAGVVYGPPPNLPGWTHVPVVSIVETAFGRPATVANDASAAALAEGRFGGWNATSLAYVTISTGVGGGLVVDGELFEGSAGNGGEPGHLSVDWRGRWCPCGARGCVEAYLSGTSIAARAREAVARESTVAGGPRSVLATIEQAGLTAADVTSAVRSGDRLANELWDETVAIAGVWLTGLVNVWEPDLLVLGGGVTNAGDDLLLEPVRVAVAASAMPAVADGLRIEFSRFADRSGLMGAAAVALRGEPAPPNRQDECA
jgi:glucokinase